MRRGLSTWHEPKGSGVFFGKPAPTAASGLSLAKRSETFYVLREERSVARLLELLAVHVEA